MTKATLRPTSRDSAQVGRSTAQFCAALCEQRRLVMSRTSMK